MIELYSPKGFIKPSLTKYLTYVLSFSSSGIMNWCQVKKSKTSKQGILVEEVELGVEGLKALF